MAFTPTGSNWNETGCTVAADGTITEDASTANRHSIWQNIQPTIDLGGFGTSARFRIKVWPLGRTRCWVGARQNNNLYMASFLLTGSGSVTSWGSNVSTASINFDVDGDGAYTCEVIFSGGFSQTGTVFGVGAMINDNQEDYDGSNGLDAIRVDEPQWNWGTQAVPYAATTDRETYPDIETADGSQDADMPASNRPAQIKPGFIEHAGNNGMPIDDFTYDLDELTVVWLGTWNGDTSAAKTIAGHWDGANQNSWLMLLTTDGKFQVSVSDDGTNVDKTYLATKALDADELTMCSFTWDGSTLRLYYNDVELTGSEVTKSPDGTISGALHNSTAGLAVSDLHYGQTQEFRIGKGAAATPTEIANLAASFSVSGLPDGTGGGGGGNIPTTRAELEAYLTGKGVSQFFYVNNDTGNDANAGTLANPWATIQKAANTLTAGQAVIIQGEATDPRFYESITPMNSGTAGNLIWYCGDPENPAIIDSSEVFTASGGSNWTSEGGGMYSAAYTKSMPFNEEAAYFSSCTIAANCRSRSTYMSHQIIYDDAQLVRVSVDDHTSGPGSLNVGECFFVCSGNTDNDYKTPTEVWVRLPGDIDPDTVEMRRATTKKTLFDWSPNTWPVDGENWPGGPNPIDRRAGRNYLGLVNLHFKFGGLSRKIAPVIFRGVGWFAEWCSFSDSGTEAVSFAGDNHTLINCKFINFGKGLKGDEFQKDAAGQTLFSKCLFENGNIHRFPEAWDAGFKVTDNSGDGGTIIWEDCLFKDIQASGFWTDISCGNANGSEEAFRFTRCIFDNCGRHAVFMENNSYYLKMEHCGIWNTQYSLDGQAGQELASGIRVAGSGRNTLTNCAIVYNEGKGWYNKPDDTRASAHGGNQDTVTNCVFVENGRNTSIELQRVEIHGGDYQGASAEDWNTSDFDDNVFFNSLGANYFYEVGVGPTDSLATFEAATTSSGNVIAASAGVVVQDHTNRKQFWITNHGGGSYPTKGPQGLVHYEDLSETGWTIPS